MSEVAHHRPDTANGKDGVHDVEQDNTNATKELHDGRRERKRPPLMEASIGGALCSCHNFSTPWDYILGDLWPP